MSSRAPAYSRATAATPPASSGVSVRIAAASSRAASPASSAVTSTSSGSAANPPQSSASAGHSQSPARSASSITRSEGRRVARAFASTSRPASGAPRREMYSTSPRSRCASAASSAASRVLPIPPGPAISTRRPAPPCERRHCSRSQSTSASRPTSGVDAPSTGGGSAASSGASCSAGSCARIARSRSRRRCPGSIPSSSTSRLRASW